MYLLVAMNDTCSEQNLNLNLQFMSLIDTLIDKQVVTAAISQQIIVMIFLLKIIKQVNTLVSLLLLLLFITYNKNTTIFSGGLMQ